MNNSDQQTVENFVTIVCGGDFAERLARAYAANQVPTVDTPKLSVVLENRSILGQNVKKYGAFDAAQRRYAMMASFVRLIRACERLGAGLISASSIPSDEILYQLRQDERRRRQEKPN